MPCSRCQGSGTNPPGSPLIVGSGILGDQPPFRHAGWTYTTGGTEPIPPCPACQGTGKKDESDGK